MTIGTLVFDKSSYKTVLCLGHILDKDGRKMSKHLGNVLEPIPLMDQHGADAVRWYMLAAGSPWSARRVGHEAITDVVRKTLLTYWNTVSFFTLYAKASDFKLTGLAENTSTMDRWILSELNSLIAKVDEAYENYDSQTAGTILGQFIDDLSNWYVRRSRRKFWDGESAALNTLYYCLKELTKLMAPMVPFITEHVWQEMIRNLEPDEFESVHLANFPLSDNSRIDEKLSKSVRLSRRLVELGRAARAESKVKIRQPLARALVAAAGWEEMDLEIRSHISDELNVQNLDEITSAGADLVSISVKANFRTIGAKFGGDVQSIAKAISALDHGDLVAKIRSTGSAMIDFGGSTPAQIDLEDLVVTETPKAGWSVASHNGESVALDLALTPDLIEAGIVREVIRAIQEERKQSGFEISDRISVRWGANPQVSAAIMKNLASIGDETLATNFDNVVEKSDDNNELGLWLELSKNN
jgi:isoleucyl-tRNA synthetase